MAEMKPCDNCSKAICLGVKYCPECENKDVVDWAIEGVHHRYVVGKTDEQGLEQELEKAMSREWLPPVDDIPTLSKPELMST